MAKFARHKKQENQLAREIKIKIPIDIRILLYLILLGISLNLYFIKGG